MKIFNTTLLLLSLLTTAAFAQEKAALECAFIDVTTMENPVEFSASFSKNGYATISQKVGTLEIQASLSKQSGTLNLDLTDTETGVNVIREEGHPKKPVQIDLAYQDNSSKRGIYMFVYEANNSSVKERIIDNSPKDSDCDHMLNLLVKGNYAAGQSSGYSLGITTAKSVSYAYILNDKQLNDFNQRLDEKLAEITVSEIDLGLDKIKAGFSSSCMK